MMISSYSSSKRPDAFHPIRRLEDWKNRMISSDSSKRLGAFHPILPIVLVQNSYHGKELNILCPLRSSDDLCLLFCINPSSSMVSNVEVGFKCRG